MAKGMYEQHLNHDFIDNEFSKVVNLILKPQGLEISPPSFHAAEPASSYLPLSGQESFLQDVPSVGLITLISSLHYVAAYNLQESVKEIPTLNYSDI